MDSRLSTIIRSNLNKSYPNGMIADNHILFFSFWTKWTAFHIYHKIVGMRFEGLHDSLCHVLRPHHVFVGIHAWNVIEEVGLD
jgi:hypothetical protein